MGINIAIMILKIAFYILKTTINQFFIEVMGHLYML